MGALHQQGLQERWTDKHSTSTCAVSLGSIYMCMYMCVRLEGQMRVSDSQEIELQGAVNLHVDANMNLCSLEE